MFSSSLVSSTYVDSSASRSHNRDKASFFPEQFMDAFALKLGVFGSVTVIASN